MPPDTVAPLSPNTPIFLNPGQSGGFGYTTTGSQSGFLDFNPLGDGISFMGGNTNFTISTLDANGAPSTFNVPVSNVSPTSVPITYGYPDSTLGAGQISITNQPAFGVGGGVVPKVPSMVPGSDAINAVGTPINNAAQTSAILSQTGFSVRFRPSEANNGAKDLAKKPADKPCETCGDGKKKDEEKKKDEQKPQDGAKPQDRMLDPTPLGPSQSFQPQEPSLLDKTPIGLPQTFQKN